MVSATIFQRSMAKSAGGSGDPADQGHVGGLVAEVAEVHRQGRLAGARDADQDDVGVDQAVGGLAVVVPDGELHRGDPLEVVGVEADLTRRHPLGPVAAGGLEREQGGPEQVAVGDAQPLAELADQLAQPVVDEGGEDRDTLAVGLDQREGLVQALGRADPRVADDPRRVPHELCLGGPGHAGRGVARRVRDHVDLDGRRRHGGQASHIRGRRARSAPLWRLLEVRFAPDAVGPALTR